MIKAVLFDSGGVIIKDIFYNGVYSNLFSHKYGCDPIEVSKLRKEVWPNYKISKISEEEFWSHIFNGVNISKDINGAKDIYEDCLELVPDTLDIIKNLSTKYTLVLANNEAKDFDFIRNKKFDFFKYFNHRFSSWMLNISKPHKKYFETILEKLNISSDNCIFIDDKEENVSVAKELGFKTIKFENSQKLQKDLAKFGIN